MVTSGGASTMISEACILVLFQLISRPSADYSSFMISRAKMRTSNISAITETSSAKSRSVNTSWPRLTPTKPRWTERLVIQSIGSKNKSGNVTIGSSNHHITNTCTHTCRCSLSVSFAQWRMWKSEQPSDAGLFHIWSQTDAYSSSIILPTAHRKRITTMLLLLRWFGNYLQTGSDHQEDLATPGFMR